MLGMILAWWKEGGGSRSYSGKPDSFLSNLRLRLTKSPRGLGFRDIRRSRLSISPALAFSPQHQDV